VSIRQKETLALDTILDCSSVGQLEDIEDARTSTGLSPLALAVIMEKWLVAETLAQRFPNLVNLEDRENLTVLQRVILSNQFQLANFIMDNCNGNIYHVTRKGYNVMHLAIMCKNIEAINYLISKKYDPHREEYYDEHDACDFIVKFGLFPQFPNGFFTKNCKLHNKKLRTPCPVVPKLNPDDRVDEKNYYEKTEREKLFENL
jgi:ankyrin repeat protein